jgi:hypothetical protein
MAQGKINESIDHEFIGTFYEIYLLLFKMSAITFNAQIYKEG